jgi:hypothetical protein
MILNRNRVYLCFTCFLPVLVTFLKPVFISVCLMSGGMCLCWRVGGGMSFGSIILTRILPSSIWFSSLNTMAFPLGICFTIFSIRALFGSRVFPVSIILYWGVFWFIFWLLLFCLVFYIKKGGLLLFSFAEVFISVCVCYVLVSCV